MWETKYVGPDLEPTIARTESTASDITNKIIDDGTRGGEFPISPILNLVYGPRSEEFLDRDMEVVSVLRPPSTSPPPLPPINEESEL